MSETAVSVIIPVYNGERFLADAIGSIRQQDYAPHEIIVVDDGSTDGSRSIAESFAEVIVLEQPNQGPAAARNLGVAAASGSVLAFLDADDVAPPSKLRVQVEYLRDHPSVGGVLGRQHVSLPPGMPTPPWLARDPVFGDLGGVNMISLVVYKRLVDEIGGFDTNERIRGGEDRDLVLRLKAAGVEIGVVDAFVLERRIHESNISWETHRDHYPILTALKNRIDRARAEGEA